MYLSVPETEIDSSTNNCTHDCTMSDASLSEIDLRGSSLASLSLSNSSAQLLSPYSSPRSLEHYPIVHHMKFPPSLLDESSPEMIQSQSNARVPLHDAEIDSRNAALSTVQQDWAGCDAWVVVSDEESEYSQRCVDSMAGENCNVDEGSTIPAWSFRMVGALMHR
jgi:hypothetical protein